ncbi:hypothetical protein HZH68_008330 [Vespula germanica]|uniref:Uncharacterized protein n=1 Tax=Vespula germanica TaxID=30212 RepID=A0A834N9Y5_VESGE|nr:hypothetical protein HZH68_008330 [Vespula germanica]
MGVGLEESVAFRLMSHNNFSIKRQTRHENYPSRRLHERRPRSDNTIFEGRRSATREGERRMALPTPLADDLRAKENEGEGVRAHAYDSCEDDDGTGVGDGDGEIVVVVVIVVVVEVVEGR